MRQLFEWFLKTINKGADRCSRILQRPGTGKRPWDYKDRQEASGFIAEWTQTAEESGIEVLKDFVKTLSHYSYGLLNYYEHPINTGKLDGFNNKIKVIKRRCYGFHDQDYFTLKIKQAAPRSRSP